MDGEKMLEDFKRSPRCTCLCASCSQMSSLFVNIIAYVQAIFMGNHSAVLNLRLSLALLLLIFLLIGPITLKPEHRSYRCYPSI